MQLTNEASQDLLHCQISMIDSKVELPLVFIITVLYFGGAKLLLLLNLFLILTGQVYQAHQILKSRLWKPFDLV